MDSVAPRSGQLHKPAGRPSLPSWQTGVCQGFSKINVFLQNDLIALNQNFPGKTNPSEHLSNSMVPGLCRNNLLFVCQWLPYLFAEFMATSRGMYWYWEIQQTEHPGTLKCKFFHRNASSKGKGVKFRMSPMSWGLLLPSLGLSMRKLYVPHYRRILSFRFNVG